MINSDHRLHVAAQRRQRMRLRLLGVAYSIAAEQGMGAVTIDAVIARAEVARGTFYKYFESPYVLLQDVGREVSDALIEVMQPYVPPLEDPAERIAAGVRIILRLVQQNPMLGGFLVRTGWPAVDVTPQFYASVGNTLLTGIAQRRFATMPVELALSLVIGTMIGAMNAIVSKTMPPELPEQTAATILLGLGLCLEDVTSLTQEKLPLDLKEFETVFASLGS